MQSKFRCVGFDGGPNTRGRGVALSFDAARVKNFKLGDRKGKIDKL